MKRILLTCDAAIMICSLWAQKTPFTPADARILGWYNKYFNVEK